jgi:hypothetical protein
MKIRLVVSAILALLFAAPFCLALEPPWYTQPGTPVVLESSGFVFRANLPRGWSLTVDHVIAPPSAYASSCRVRGTFYTGLDWNSFLESSLRSANGVRAIDGTRFVQNIGGHPAVSNRYVRELSTVDDMYINLSDLQPDSGVVWTFEGNSTPEGVECEHQFLFMISRARITRRK